MREPTDAGLAALSAMIEPFSNLGMRVQSPAPQPESDLDGAGAGHRVLVIGPDAGRTALAFAARGVEQVVACVPPDAVLETQAGEPGLRSRVELRGCRWDALDPGRDGTFDIVHCAGVLHCVLEPIALLRRLRSVTADGGTLLIGSLMLADPEQSELLRLVPDPRDPWWFVPGRLAFRWMVTTAGFEVEAELGERDGPRDHFPVVSGYLRARADQRSGGPSPEADSSSGTSEREDDRAGR